MTSRCDDGAETRAERVVVGMAMNDRKCLERVFEIGVAPSMFADEALAQIFAAMIAADARGQRPSVSTMTREMPTHAAVAMDCARSAPVAQNVDYYANEVIVADWQRRTTRDFAQLSQAIARRSAFDDIAALKSRAEALLRDMQDVRQCDGPVPIARVMEICLTNLEARMTGSAPAGISTGLRALDMALSGGWRPARLYFPAARPGKGKTTFAVNAMEAASAEGRPVIFFTIEMPLDQIGEKQISLGSMVGGPKLVRGDLNADEGDRVVHAINTLKDRPIWIDDSSRGDIDEIAARCRRLHRSGQLHIAFIDYLQLLRAPGRWQSRVAELTHITGTLKHLALELRIPIVCLSTINREAEKFDAPGIHHLKDCGSIEQDGDAVMLMHRDKNEKTWMNVAKNRHGPEGAFMIDVDPSISRVRDSDGRVPEAFARA